MQIKKIIGLALSVMMVGAMFTGCGSSTSSSSGTSSSEASSSEASSSETSSSESSSTADTKMSGTVKISGSTSMEKLAKGMQEAFNEEYPNIVIDVQLGGSSTGIKNALEGVSDIGNSSRELKDTETGLDATVAAIDGISVIVNPSNKVKDLSLEDIAKIYSGEIKNWKDVGGDDLAIVVVGRESGSGTRDGFEDVVGIKEKAKYAQELTETGAVKTAVENTKGAIGYVSTAYVDEKVVALTVAGIEGNETTILDGTYPIQRPFLMVTKTGNVKPEVKAFLDFVTGEKGREIAKSQKLFVK